MNFKDLEQDYAEAIDHRAHSLPAAFDK